MYQYQKALGYSKTVLWEVMMGFKMPVLDGFEAFKKIKMIKSDIIMIAQTAFANPENVKKINEYGFDGFVSKPIKKSKLVELLNKL